MAKTLIERQPKADFKVSYSYRKGGKGKPGLVYIKSAQNDDKQTAWSTGVKLLREQWDAKKGRPKGEHARLVEIASKFQETYRALLEGGEVPTLPMLVKQLNDKRKPLGKAIVDWADDYLAGAYSEGQKKAVKTLKSNVEEYNKGLTFDKLTKPRIKDFFDWLTKQGVANNSQYKRLRALVNLANHANIDANELRAYEMPYSTTNAMTPRLTWAEVKKVMKTPAKSEIEQVAKDVFLLACFGGLRIEDILQPIEPKIHASYYSAIMRKTKREVYVTLTKYNEPLFRKYIGKVNYSRQRLSDALKNVLERAGLTQDVIIIRNVGHRQEVVKVPKFKAIAFHAGRRFYSRLLNDLGLGGEIARDELGHSFKSMTELYAGSQEHALRITRVRSAMETMEKKMSELSALMKVA